ncbi:MAG: DUF1566 domain-containing protein [Nitrospirae bacterium]|nr:DUF1566 domain-containing protein [Nitrospirota bacterium]
MWEMTVSKLLRFLSETENYPKAARVCRFCLIIAMISISAFFFSVILNRKLMLSFVLSFLISGLLSMFYGFKALKSIGKSQEKLKGKGYAITGIILGSVMIGGFVVLSLYSIFIVGPREQIQRNQRDLMYQRDMRRSSIIEEVGEKAQQMLDAYIRGQKYKIQIDKPENIRCVHSDKAINDCENSCFADCSVLAVNRSECKNDFGVYPSFPNGMDKIIKDIIMQRSFSSKEGFNYSSTPGKWTVVIKPGETAHTINIEVYGDDVSTPIDKKEIKSDYVEEALAKIDKKTGKESYNNADYDVSEYTITDRITKLMWTRDSIPCGEKVQWKSVDKCIKKMNDQKYAGFSNWRMPNKAELESLGIKDEITYDAGSEQCKKQMEVACAFSNVDGHLKPGETPAFCDDNYYKKHSCGGATVRPIDKAGFKNACYPHWTSTQIDKEKAWTGYFSGIMIMETAPRSYEYYVWPVRNATRQKYLD